MIFFRLLANTENIPLGGVGFEQRMIDFPSKLIIHKKPPYWHLALFRRLIIRYHKLGAFARLPHGAQGDGKSMAYMRDPISKEKDAMKRHMNI